MYQVQIAVTRSWPLQWINEGAPMSSEDADKLIEYHKWLDSRPPVATHYLYRKVEVSST